MVGGRGGGETVVRRWRGSPPKLRPQVLLAVVRPLRLHHLGGVRLLLTVGLLLLSLTGRCERALADQGSVKPGKC